MSSTARQEEMPARCPFCNAEQILHDDYEWLHPDNGCLLSNFGVVKECIHLWNRRAPAPRDADSTEPVTLPSDETAAELQTPEDTPANGEGRDAIALLNELIRVGRSADGSLELDLRRAIAALRAESKRLVEIRQLAQTICAEEGHHQRFDRALRDLRAALAKEQGG